MQAEQVKEAAGISICALPRVRQPASKKPSHSAEVSPGETHYVYIELAHTAVQQKLTLAKQLYCNFKIKGKEREKNKHIVRIWRIWNS